MDLQSSRYEVARSKWSEVDSTDADSTVQMSTNDERSSMSEDESIDIDPKIQEPAGSVVSTVSTVSAWGEPPVIGLGGGQRGMINIQVRMNGVAMEPTVVDSFWSGGRLHLHLTCKPKAADTIKKNKDVKWAKVAEVFGKTPSERLKAGEEGGTFNFKGKILDVSRATTSIGQDVVLLTFSQSTSRVRVVFWEKHISYFNSCNLTAGDRVMFYDINLSKYYGGCLEATYYTRAVKYKRT